MSFDFPPPNAGGNFKKIEIVLPEFNGFVGNFPFIRQELIEKKSKGYKKKLTKLLAEEYFFSYPALFELEKINENEIEELKNRSRDKQLTAIYKWVDDKLLGLKLSGKADIYSYIFIHLTTLLAKSGRFAIITSNSWLDVSYGAILKQFFLDHFKIKMIAASWEEPWFQDASVNTVFTVLEKEEDPKKQKENLTKFVKFNKKLADLIPYPNLRLQSSDRWKKIENLQRHIEGAEFDKDLKSISKEVKQLNAENFDVRIIQQSDLETELENQGEYSKWGKHLRAPDVYYEILENCQDKLIPLNSLAEVKFGIKTGKNAFFYLQVIKEKGEVSICRNSRGWEGPIETKFLREIIKSPKQSNKIRLEAGDLDRKIFLCRKSKNELKKEGFQNALAYIEWGERQKTSSNVKWPDIPSVQGRSNWYSLGITKFSDFLWPKAFNDRFVVFENGNFLAADRLYEIYFNEDSYLETAFYTLNSTLQYLFIEVNGRINLGDGALDNMTYEAGCCLTIDPQEIKLDGIEENTLKRKSDSIFKEVKKKDRNELDAVILKKLNLDPDEYLPRIYNGLCKMVRERLELPKMRKKQQKQTVKVAYDQVKESVIKDCLPNGFKQFPEAFFNPSSAKGDGISGFNDLTIDTFSHTGKPLIIKEFFGEYEVDDIEGNKIFQADSRAKAEYAQILVRPNRYQLKIPRENAYVVDMVKNYTGYVKDLKSRLESNAQTKLHDWSAAEKMAEEILEEFGLKELE